MKNRILYIGIFSIICAGHSISGSELGGSNYDQTLSPLTPNKKHKTYKKKENDNDQKKVTNNQNNLGTNSIQDMNKVLFGNMDDSHPTYGHQDDPNIKIVNPNFFPESPFKKYRYIFKNSWEPKETTLNDVQDLPLGAGYFMSYLVWSHLQIVEDVIAKAKAKQNEINYQNNLSLLRKIANDLVIIPLETNEFDIVKKTLNICRKNKIHRWTAPDISKTEIEKKRNNINAPKEEKNTVQQAFFDCRTRLSQVIQDSIRLFAQKIPDQKVPEHIPAVIPQDQIESLKTLYILAILAHNIHNQEYKKFSEVETDFSDVTYIDVLRLVSPESEGLVEQTLANFRQMQEESKSNKESRGTLLNTVGKRTNLDESIVDPKSNTI
jgi:hypothetical protein